MLDLELPNFLDLLTDLSSRMKTLKPPPIWGISYFEKLLSSQWQQQSPSFPMTIRIPPPTQEMLAGNMEPQQVFQIDKPFTWGPNNIPIWFTNSSKGVNLRLGYKNLDIRQFSNVSLSDAYIHGFLGGSSGQGKSVTLNTMIMGICLEYPPWEVELHLSDAKIIEFKKYGMTNIIPHIRSIAATSDADYVISVLEGIYTEMVARQELFGKLQVSKISDFRAKYNMVLPQIVVIMDEINACLASAGKKANRILELIDAYATLGRASGTHILMATQNLTSNIPSTTMGQVGIRMSLGTTPENSTKILNNPAAANYYGRKGCLICNIETLKGQDTIKSNVLYQSPFFTDDQLTELMAFQEKTGKETPYVTHLNFYDEKNIVTTDNLLKRIQTIQARDNSKEPFVILGEPAFVSPDSDNLLKVFFDGSDIENFLILADGTKRDILLKTIAQSFLARYKVFYFYNNASIKDTVLTKVQLECSSVEQETWKGLIGVFYERSVKLSLDQIASAYAEGSLMERRNKAWTQMSKLAEYKQALSYNRASFEQIMSSLPKDHYVTKKDFNPLCIILGDLNKIVGLGRGPKTAPVNLLKTVLQDAFRYNIITILFSSSLEGITDLVPAIRYFLYDGVKSSEYTKTKVEDPPDASLPSCLICFFDSSNPQQGILKFKRTTTLGG